jgi:sec-independent protein translocase protein TatC
MAEADEPLPSRDEQSPEGTKSGPDPASKDPGKREKTRTPKGKSAKAKPGKKAPETGDAETDDVEASRAPLMDHLLELRNRLIWCVAAVVVGFIGCFLIATPLYQFLIQPLVSAAEGARGIDAETMRVDLIFTSPLEFFFVKLKLALFGGVIVAFPVIAWHVYRFIAPGLYKQERAAFIPFVLAAPILFVMGASFVFFVMLPYVMNFAFSQEIVGSGGADIRMLPSVAAYLSLVMALILAFGLSFQLPVVLSLMGKAGMVTASGLAKGRKYAIVGILAFAAFFTPPDVVSQVLLAVPVLLLYEVSIWCVRAIDNGRAKRDAAREAAD